MLVLASTETHGISPFSKFSGEKPTGRLNFKASTPNKIDMVEHFLRACPTVRTVLTKRGKNRRVGRTLSAQTPHNVPKPNDLMCS
jgi:hypothetical protein